MLILLALLERLAPLLPQSWRAFAYRRYVQLITPNSPAQRTQLERLGALLVDAAETDDEIIAAIAFDHRTRATAMLMDRSDAFHRDRARRMTRLCGTEARQAALTLPDAQLPRALDLSG